MQSRAVLLLIMLLAGCSGTSVPDSPGFISVGIDAGNYRIFTSQRFSDSTSPVHIYIEGDGYAFDARGRPTSDPTPHGTFIYDLATKDTSPNVVYMARPCQYVWSDACTRADWTDGRFAPHIIDSMASAIRSVAASRPVILIGYSGGAMISGLVINQNPDLNIKKWITIAGVLNHSKWTQYFGDAPLSMSVNLDTLPRLPQAHYIASGDKVVPNELSYQWTAGANITTVQGATHSYFPNLELDFK